MWNIQLFHTFNTCSPGPKAESGLKRRELGLPSPPDHLHAPIRKIPYPASKPQRLGLPHYEPTEPDPLHPAGDQPLGAVRARLAHAVSGSRAVFRAARRRPTKT